MVSSATRTQKGSGLTLALLAFAQFIVALDYNIVYVALPDIGRELGFTAQSLQWVVSAYVVAFGGLLLLGGRAVDRLGARRLFITGLVLYGAASLVGGLAEGPGVLIAARAIQGVGGALLTPATLALVAINFEEGAARTKAMAVWGAAGSGGLAAGALLGGLLTNYLGWTWVFYVNVPLALIAVLAAPRLLGADARSTGPKTSFDLPGAIIASIGSTLLVFGLATGPESGWGSSRTVGSLAVGVVLLLIFLVVENKASDPLVPLRMLTGRGLAVTMLVFFLFQGTLATGYYLFTTYLQNVLGYSPLSAGLAFLPLTLISMGSSTKFVGPLMGKWGVGKTLAFGSFFTGLGMGILAVGMSVGGSFWALVPGIVVWGLGGGIAFPSLFIAAAVGARPGEQGVSSALASTSQQIGGAVGLAALVAVANAGLDVSKGATPEIGAVVDGLQLTGYLAAVITIAAAALALLFQPPAPEPAAEPAEAALDENQPAGQVTGAV
ncbi:MULTISPECIES: MFS transporter [unclassified Streptomyces]|uniref:MFS transporter n=1 Tax=unclassified Streptomyces TaxID=2593676 RepID=UPI003700D17F